MKTTITVLALLLLLSCSRDSTSPSDPNTRGNRPLLSFTVTVEDRAPATAVISWSEATNIHNGDTVKYKVVLGKRLIDSNLIRTSDTIMNLSADTAYNGIVYAYTKSGDTASAPFFLPRLNGFIYYYSGDYRLNCYELYTGKTVWRSRSLAPEMFHGIPTIVNNVLYVNSLPLGVRAFNAKTGEEIWHAKLGGGNTIAGNPLYANGKIYTVVDNGFYALNSENGAVIWNYPVSQKFDAYPVLAGNLLISAAITSTTAILAVNIETGEKAWEYHPKTFICKNPVVYKHLLIFGGDNGRVYALDTKTGLPAWSRDFPKGYWNVGCDYISPVIFRDLVIVHSGNSGFYGLNASTGATVWNYPLGTQQVSSPAIGNNKVYISHNDNPYTKVIALDAATGQLSWEQSLGPDEVWATPIFANNRLYLGNNLTWGYDIRVLNAKTGKRLPTLYSNNYQNGRETILENDTTYYLAQSGMVN